MHVFEHTSPILLVSRAEGDWCFLCGDEHDDSASMYRVVGMVHLLELDPTLQLVLDLPSEWEAERKSKDDPWLRTPCGPPVA